MSSDDIAISAKNLTKAYRVYGHPLHRVMHKLGVPGLRGYRQIEALTDVSFDIRKGEAVGIIGRNGSGKSTLLQIICGILKPSSGSVTVNGRISALLELGAGFHPEFTGRENVFMQGAILGLSRHQMENQFDAIAAFADIGEFLDQPVKIYSSGMFVRLAFAVAISINPEILVVDEALAVGDAKFQARSFRRMREMRDNGGTLLFVTHSLEQLVRACERGMVLDRGKQRFFGESRKAVNYYMESLFSGNDVASNDESPPSSNLIDDRRSNLDLQDVQSSYSPLEHRWGNQAAVIQRIELRQGNQVNASIFRAGIPIVLEVEARFTRDIPCPVFGIAIKSKEGVLLCGTNSRELNPSEPYVGRKSGEIVRCAFRFEPWLTSGTYLISLGLVNDHGIDLEVLDRRYDVIELVVAPGSAGEGLVEMNPKFDYLGVA
jgi:lipopolysaccharide transport system ATP-binding protein